MKILKPYIAGRKNVTLGWDTDKCPLGDGVLEGLQKEFSSGHEYYYEEEMENLKGDYQEQIEEAEENGDFVKADELRTADIGDMIVEVDSRQLDEEAPSLDQAVISLKQGTFTLPTEDEWEYLCNGGTRTLFWWGDTLRDVMREIYNVGAAGCSLCGGDGAIYVLPCYTAFYRHPVNERRPGLLKNYFCYRRIIRLP